MSGKKQAPILHLEKRKHQTPSMNWGKEDGGYRLFFKELVAFTLCEDKQPTPVSTWGFTVVGFSSEAEALDEADNCMFSRMVKDVPEEELKKFIREAAQRLSE